ncbi:MAG: hypothetical protein R2867_28510 [Caldilineaceae bacterium]
MDESPLSGTQSGLVRNAALLSVGNIASRVLGLEREMVIARLFFKRSVMPLRLRVKSRLYFMIF